MQYSKFAVDEKAFCMWEWDLHERNLAFINNIDPAYFEYVANTHRDAMKIDEQRQHAALSLRTAYSHGLETFFALLFATIQAPDCVIGWLHKYDIGDLRSLIEKVNKWQPIHSKLKIKPITWDVISNTVHESLSLEDKAKEEQIKVRYAREWGRLAADLSDVKMGLEYNSIKHGFRVKSGGFRLAVGLAGESGAAPEKMHLLGDSEFGSSFFIPEKIDTANKLNFRAKRHSINWKPEKLFYDLFFISASIKNVIAYLNVLNGVDAANVQFCWLNEETYAYLRESRKPTPGMTSTGFDHIITEEDIASFSKDQILSVYEIID